MDNGFVCQLDCEAVVPAAGYTPCGNMPPDPHLYEGVAYKMLEPADTWDNQRDKCWEFS